MIEQLSRVVCALPDRVWLRVQDGVESRDRPNEYLLTEETSERKIGRKEGGHYAFRVMFWWAIIVGTTPIWSYIPAAYQTPALGVVFTLVVCGWLGTKTDIPEYRYLGDTGDDHDPLEAWAQGGDD